MERGQTHKAKESAGKVDSRVASCFQRHGRRNSEDGWGAHSLPDPDSTTPSCVVEGTQGLGVEPVGKSRDTVITLDRIIPEPCRHQAVLRDSDPPSQLG